MGDEASLAGFIVIGNDDQHRVGSNVGCRPYELNRRSGRVAATARDYRNPAIRDLHRMVDDLAMLVAAESRAFPGRPAGNQRVRSFRNLPLDELAECVLHDTPAREWRDQRRNRAEKHELTSSNGSWNDGVKAGVHGLIRRGKP